MERIGVPAPLYAGDRPVAAADVAAGAVQWVRELAAEREGGPDAWTVVTVPPSWAGHRRAELARALAAAGVPRFSLVSSAVAATHHHVTTGDLPAEPTVAVYDLGATTLDTAVVGPTADEALAHLAHPPAPQRWGGRDVDDAVLAHVRRCSGTPEGDRTSRSRARTVRAACVAAKEALSASTVVDVDVDGAEGPVRLTREELDEVLTAPILTSVEVLAGAIAGSGLDLGELDGIVLAGGGVRVPLVAETLSGELGRPLLVAADPALTAALGAAALAAEALTVEAMRLEQPVPAVPGPGEPVPADGVPATAALAVDGPPEVAPPQRLLRRRVRTAPPARTPAGRPTDRTARLRRGAVVTGALLGLVVLPPTLADVLGGDVTATSSGQGATDTPRDGVIASGSAAIGSEPSPTTVGPQPAQRRGAGSGGGQVAAVAPGGSPVTSLAAAITTAARTSSAARTPGSDVAGTPAPRSTPPPATAPGTTAPSSSGGTSSPDRPPAQTPPPVSPSADPPPVETPPADPPPVETPPADPPPVETPPSDPPPVETPPSDPPPVETPPADPPPAETPPADPAPTSEEAAPPVAEL
nr:Hsp70 family protein [Geodermatophilus sabuli]